jgi:hypothetical protein
MLKFPAEFRESQEDKNQAQVLNKKNIFDSYLCVSVKIACYGEITPVIIFSQCAEVLYTERINTGRIVYGHCKLIRPIINLYFLYVYCCCLHTHNIQIPCLLEYKTKILS